MDDSNEKTEDNTNTDGSGLMGWINAFGRGIGTAFGAYVIALFVIYMLRDTVLFASDPSSSIIQVAGLVAEFSIIGVSILVAAYVFKVNEYIDFSKPNVSDLKIVLIAVGIMLVLQVLSTVFTTVFSIESASNVVVEQGESNPIYFLYLIPVMLIFVGPVEEYVFRGVIQSTFTRFVNFKIGIVFASISFGLIHISATGGPSLESIPYVVTASLLGGVLGYYYEETGNIIVPMLAHGVYNSILMFIVFLSLQFG